MATEVSPDGRDLRFGRRQRALAQMEAHDIDVLVLGRQANVRYVTGAPQLWIGGTRPFGPVCVMLRGTGEIYLMSTDDEGVPEEIGRDRLYGLAWNPMTLIEVLKKIDGASTARRVGTDAITPTFAKLLPVAFPNAEFVDGELPMRTARRIKTADEVAAMSTAVRVADAGIAAAVAELRPGLTEQTLTGAVLEAMAAGGVSTPATQDAAWVTSREHPWRRAPGDGEVRSGDLIVFGAGALADGYVAEVGRTWPVGDAANEVTGKLYQRLNELWDRLIAACRPGACAADGGRARPGARLRSAGDHAAASGHRRRRKAGPGDGARAHRLRVAGRPGRCASARHRRDHRRWARRADRQPVVAVTGALRRASCRDDRRHLLPRDVRAWRAPSGSGATPAGS